jgi:hypothetical protein
MKKVFAFNTQEYVMRVQMISLMVDGLRFNVVIAFLMRDQNANEPVIMWTSSVIKECIQPLQMLVTRAYRSKMLNINIRFYKYTTSSTFLLLLHKRTPSTN